MPIENLTKYKNDYANENYDRIAIFVPKGKREVLKALAKREGVSVNTFVNIAIEEKVARLESETGK